MYLNIVSLPSFSPTWAKYTFTEWVRAVVMSISPNCSPPAFESGTPPITCGECPLSTELGVNSPESSAAAAVTTFIVEPGSYVLWVGRLTSGALWSLLSCLRVLGSLTRLGSKPGTEAIAKTAPVEGSIATTEPPAPLAPGVEEIADWSDSG